MSRRGSFKLEVFSFKRRQKTWRQKKLEKKWLLFLLFCLGRASRPAAPTLLERFTAKPQRSPRDAEGKRHERLEIEE